MSSQAGKGDSPRPVNPTVYAENYDAIFRKDKPEPKPEPKPEQKPEHEKQP